MSYKISLGGWNSVFAVPAAVVDTYIKLAGGNSLKVLLYFLRNAGQALDAAAISAAVGVKPDDVEDALLFWEQVGLLRLDGENALPSEKPHVLAETPPILPKAPEKSPAEAHKSLVKIELEREPKFKPREIAKAVRENGQVDFLFKHAEKLMGRPLKHSEHNTLMIIIEEAGLSVECALMLVEYCFSIGRATPAYMKKLTCDWVEKDIKTIEQAENEIKLMKTYHSVEAKLKAMFEVNSAFSREQRAYISKWVNDYAFSLDMLDEAYQITLNGAGKLAFPYMDKVLTKWRETGVKTPAAVKAEKQSRKEKVREQEASSFDLEDYTRAAMQKYSDEKEES